MVVDIDRFPDGVSSQPFDVLPPHAGPEQVRGEPVAAAVRAELFIQLGGGGIVEPDHLSVFGHQGRDMVAADPLSLV